MPPSATEQVAVRETVVASVVSVMLVVAAARFTTSDSKLPPVAVAIVAETEPASMYTSSLGAATETVPIVAPLAMLIVAPFDSVTVTAPWAALVRLAV